MSSQNILHPHLLHPPQPFLGIRLLIPLPCYESVALQPSTRHQDKDTERRVAEPESLRQRLTVAPNQRVHGFDVAVVGRRQGIREWGVAAGEFEEGARCGHAEEAAELVVAGDGAFAVPEEVDGPHVAVEAVGGGEVAEERWVVVVCDGAGVVDAEGVEGVCEGHSIFIAIVAFQWALGFGEKGLFDGDGTFVLSGLGAEEGDGVGD